MLKKTALYAPTHKRLVVERLATPESVRESQALRYKVFTQEFGVKLDGAEAGYDQDAWDPYCMHIGVRDQLTQQLVASTRLLDQKQALSYGHFYSENEFVIQGIELLDGMILEVGRTCVDANYRNGATIGVLWLGLVEIYNEGHYRYLMGCASIPMTDNGRIAQGIMHYLRENHLMTSDYLNITPRNPLPIIDESQQSCKPIAGYAEMPPLLKAYVRMGARVFGHASWDPHFQTADVFVLVKRDEICPRYARRFKALKS